MQCADVGFETWLLFTVSSLGVFLFLFVTRPFQKWLREHRAVYGGLGMLPGVFFRDAGVWAIRALGVIPALMLMAAGAGVYCFFRGPG